MAYKSWHFASAAHLRRIIAACATVTALLLSLGSPPAIAAPGDLDLSFNATGKRLGVTTGGVSGNKLLEQPDGKIVIVGTTGFGDIVGSIARIKPDGTLDTGFGNGGHTIVDTGTGNISLGQ